MAVTNRKAMQKHQEAIMKEFVKSLPDDLQRVPPSDYQVKPPPGLIEAWRSKKYAVQIYDEGSGVIRLSVNRTSRHKGKWADKLTWDELQQIKHDVGFGDSFAVEIYPKNEDVVNVANMRHLWVLPVSLGFAWTKDKQ